MVWLPIWCVVRLVQSEEVDVLNCHRVPLGGHPCHKPNPATSAPGTGGRPIAYSAAPGAGARGE